MSENRSFQVRVFASAAGGALFAAAVIYVVLSKIKIISPLGTVVVPILTFVVTTIVGYLYARHRAMER